MTIATCGNCGVGYNFPDNVSYINCACGAKIFRPKEEKYNEPDALKSYVLPDSLAKKIKTAIKKGLKEENAPAPPKEETPKEPKKKLVLEDKTLPQKLMAIPGIAKKMANEICEEYKTVEEIHAAIKNKTFSVGGVGIFRKQIILRFLK